MRTHRLESFTPKLVHALRDYSGRKFIADLIAGLTVGRDAFWWPASDGSDRPHRDKHPLRCADPPVAGMIHALVLLLYIVKVTGSTTVARVTPKYVEAGFSHSLQLNPLPEGVAAYHIHGPFLFGATDKLGFIEEELETLPSIVIMRLRNMTAIDANGLHALEHLAERLVASGRHLILCGMRAQPAKLMTQADFHRHIGGENICLILKAAVERAKEILRNPSATHGTAAELAASPPHSDVAKKITPSQ